MGKLWVELFVTLDGVYQAPGGPEEDASGGFPYGGWQQPVSDKEGGAAILERIAKMDALLLGRKTYDIFAAYWPKQPADNPVAKKFNGKAKYVASRSMKKADWKGTTIVRDDLVKEVSKIKAKHKQVHTWGSGDLVRQLIDLNLVDRLELWVYPVLLGTGKRLFDGGSVPATLKLVESKAYPKGAVHLVYEPVGKPTFGTMGAQ